jgi:hypothetical protein
MNHSKIRSLILSLLLLGSVVQSAFAKSPPGLLLTRNGRAVSCIAISKDASASDRQAAGELQKYIRLISGAELKITEHGEIRGLRCVWLGSSGRSAGFPPELDWAKLEDDGFTIQTKTSRGTMLDLRRWSHR